MKSHGEKSVFRVPQDFFHCLSVAQAFYQPGVFGLLSKFCIKFLSEQLLFSVQACFTENSMALLSVAP